jgi:hypothetical protein
MDSLYYNNINKKLKKIIYISLIIITIITSYNTLKMTEIISTFGPNPNGYFILTEGSNEINLLDETPEDQIISSINNFLEERKGDRMGDRSFGEQNKILLKFILDIFYNDKIEYTKETLSPTNMVSIIIKAYIKIVEWKTLQCELQCEAELYGYDIL